jgi:hypothetical protein
MATTFDVNRIGGGTFELVQDPSTGQYSYKKVGFTPVKSLTIPDLGTTTTTPEKKPEQDDATDISKPYEQLVKQTGGGEPIDYTGQMLKDAKKIDPQLPMTRESLTSSFIGEERPTKTYAEQLADLQRPSMLGDRGGSMDQMSGATPYQDDIMRGGTGVKADTTRGPGILTDKKPLGSPFKAFDASVKSGVISRPEYTSTTPEARAAMTSDAASLGIKEVESTQPTIGSFGTDPTSSLGIKKVESTIVDPTTQIGSQDIESDVGTKTRPDIEAEPSVLQKIGRGVKNLLEGVGKVLSSGPLAELGRIIGRPVNESPGTVALNQTYFNVRGGSVDRQRIAGNPATDLYAGMNRTSRYGNLEKAGAKRIATREATAKRKGYTKDNDPTGFVAKTENMKKQEKDYKAAKKSAPVTGTTKPGTSGGSGATGGSQRVICTELHKTGEMLTEDWVRDIRFTYSKLTKKHIKGYLYWAVPTVRHIKKYPTYRKIWKHIAQHRANDIAWRMKQGKFDLLGRIYAGIGEPLCWLIGNFVTDKTYNDIIAKGKRHI